MRTRVDFYTIHLKSLPAALSVIVAYLQPAAWVVFPRAEERADCFVKAGVKHVESLHRDAVVEAEAPFVVVQKDADPGGVPVVGHRDASVLVVGVQPVLQTQAPVSCGGREVDEALPVAALGGDSQVPHALVPHIHLPVVLATGVLGYGQHATEAAEAAGRLWVLVTNVALLHFGVKVRDDQVRLSGVGVQGQVLRHCRDREEFRI